MNLIRKIWIGKSIKEDSMSWHVGQTVNLGGGTGVVNHIEYDDNLGVYHVYVKRGDSISIWKTSSMSTTVEYDLSFE